MTGDNHKNDCQGYLSQLMLSKQTWKMKHVITFINYHLKDLKYLSNTVSGLRKPFIYQPIYTTVLQLKSFRSPIKFTKPRTLPEDDTTSAENEDNFKDEDIDVLLDRTLLRRGSGHQVFIIQPVIKWGPKKKKNTTPQLQLLESVTLIKTLRQWKVVDKTIITLESFNKKTFFGKGNLQMFQNLINTKTEISAVFISINTLSMAQQLTLEQVFGVPVFDRYTIIIHILREHATSREAKLQIQLAELPYLWTLMKGMNLGIGQNFGGGAELIGGLQPKLLTYRKEVFKLRRAKLLKEISDIREKRQSFRKAREKKEMPVIAVVGYTNAGKTSVVKVLTGKESLEPQDYLFATLDVSSHIGKLPCGLNVYFIDTLGFISDIPTYLIESFVATLEDVVYADLIIHIRDISHPDAKAQNDIVNKTLRDLNLSENAINNILTVGNKIDLVEKAELVNYKDENMILVSCTDLTGIDILRQEIEKKVLASSGKHKIVMRVRSGSEEYDWLHLETTVVEESPDPKDVQFTLMRVIISPSTLAKFKYHFIQNYKNR